VASANALGESQILQKQAQFSESDVGI